MGSFFVKRPVFAAAIAMIITLIGGISYFALPTARFPQIAPPNVTVDATFTGGDAREVAKAVATPIEHRINGAPGMIYIQSISTNDGQVTINATFAVGSDLNAAAADVLTRVNRATPDLPQSVQHQGVEIRRSSRQLLSVVALYSKDSSAFDQLFLSNYAETQVIPALQRVKGIGQVRDLSSKRYAIRIWLDPAKMEYMHITPAEVTAAVQAQNREVAAGKLGASPAQGNPTQLTRTLVAEGRLLTTDQFGDIVVRADPNGSVVRIHDIARVEMGSEVYGVTSRYSGHPSATINIYQEPGANAVAVMNGVRATMQRLAQRFPHGVHYGIAQDRTQFVSAAIHEVLITLAIAIALVIGVTYLFLQNWRATLIPSLAIPVSLIGTFAPMIAFGFSLNTLSLLGLVLAVGLVVDDAIVVVENVERQMEDGHPPAEATTMAMAEVTGPVIATTLVLLALFIPVAFIPGITGRLYNQFALTIAFSVGFSGLVSLTLTPALCALLLKQREEEDPDHGKGWVHTLRAPLRWIDSGLIGTSTGLANAVGWLGRHVALVALVFAGLIAVTVLLFLQRPTGFVPSEDQGYFYAVVEMQPGATIERTQAVVNRIEKRLLADPSVTSTVSVAGDDDLTDVTAPYYGFVVPTLKPWEQRGETAEQIMARLQPVFDSEREGRVRLVNPSTLPGLGTHGGLTLEIEDRSGGSFDALQRNARDFITKIDRLKAVESAFPTTSGGVPQVRLDVDRVKAQQLGVDVGTLFDTIGLYVGSSYVNLFNRFGRTYQVYLQAGADSRRTEADLAALTVPNRNGDPVRLSTLVTPHFVSGTTAVTHYNTYPAVEVSITPSASSGAALAAVRKLAAEQLPRDYDIEWTDVAYQQIKTGHDTPIIFAFGILLVFLVLAAQYESWLLPLVVVLSVPLAALGALGILALRAIPLNVFAQIGLLVLVGLAAKNGILLVAFAQEKRAEGVERLEAAKLAARLRMRPIVMTALAFILGTLPLAIASGAGANARIAIGSTVVGGMAVATILTLFITPAFYVAADRFASRFGKQGSNRKSAPPGGASKAEE